MIRLQGSQVEPFCYYRAGHQVRELGEAGCIHDETGLPVWTPVSAERAGLSAIVVENKGINDRRNST